MFKHFLSAVIAVVSMTTAVSAAQSGEAPARFNIATYNLRCPAEEDSLAGDTWQRRCPELAKVILYHDFDIFGTQEGVKYQLETLKKQLPGYEYIGVGRSDGKTRGEHAAIFYNTDIFDLVDHGDFWLSQTPDKPGLGWDAACYRVCTWGKFRHRPSGREFLYFNLHMDHIGKVARIESVKLIREKIKEFGSDLPTFLSGDFNVDQTNECYKSIVDSGVFNDSYAIARYAYAPNGTWNAWKPNGFSKSRIDHIFVTPGITVDKYGILTDSYFTCDTPDADLDDTNEGYDVDVKECTRRLPSDHYPVVITIQLP